MSWTGEPATGGGQKTTSRGWFSPSAKGSGSGIQVVKLGQLKGFFVFCFFLNVV